MVFSGTPLKEAMEKQRNNLLFWNREVCQRAWALKGGKGEAEGEDNDERKGRQRGDLAPALGNQGVPRQAILQGLLEEELPGGSVGGPRTAQSWRAHGSAMRPRRLTRRRSARTSCGLTVSPLGRQRPRTHKDPRANPPAAIRDGGGRPWRPSKKGDPGKRSESAPNLEGSEAMAQSWNPDNFREPGGEPAHGNGRALGRNGHSSRRM